MDEERTPTEVREGIRAGVITALRRDVELRGGHTARLLLLAGVVGAAGAIGATLLVASHPLDHHPTWHVATFSAVWAALLCVALALVLLQIRTPALPIARAAMVGLLGLAIAGLCSLACPEGHFLVWWSATALGARLDARAGLAASALCFGLVSSTVFGAGAALLAARPPFRPLLPSLMLVALLTPGVALQSFGNPASAFAGWWIGSAAGSYAGVATGIRLRALLQRS